ncbi:hypothetical protein DY124_04895 [Apilactobacillus micheneri]|nr:hypothetical protein DY124_04895 [Apilactobacillus micheneri]
MFWRIFTMIVFIFTIIDGIVYFRNKHKSKHLVEKILQNDENKQAIMQILSTDQEDAVKVKNLRKHFDLKLGESLDIFIKYKKTKVNQ